MAPLPSAPGTHGTHELHWDPAAERLVALARNAHRNVDHQDLRDDITTDDVDYWYRLGQRNAYAHAAGILIGRGVDSTAFAVSERLTAALEAGVTDLSPLRSHVLGGLMVGRLRQSPTWLGPVAFRAQYGSDHNTYRGIDHDYGMRWGAAGDQRISLRHPPGAEHGLLYAYDPTWDEYAVLSRAVSVQAVQAAFTQAVATDPHLAVTDFAALVTALDVANTLQAVAPHE
ncbi:MAG TPA: hypothetical protein VGN19_03390, partial [Pedococcus sp.]|nr:hypothetical protein [Pedococcus sp.]